MTPIDNDLKRLHVRSRGYWFKYMIPMGLAVGAIQAVGAGLPLENACAYALGSAAMWGVAALGADIPKALRRGQSRRLRDDQFPYLSDLKRIPAAGLGVFIGTQVLQWMAGQYDYMLPTIAQQLINGVCWGAALAAGSEYLYHFKPKGDRSISSD